MASKSFQEALETSTTGRIRRRQDIAADGGPWDELAAWYWGLWNELDVYILPEQPESGGGQCAVPSTEQSVDNIVSTPRNGIDISASEERPSDLPEEQLILGLVSSIGKVGALAPDHIIDLPPRPVRDLLVSLFFKHVHPLCPVFNEVEMHAACCDNGGDLSFLQCLTMVEFQALLFAGSLVISLHEYVLSINLSVDANTASASRSRADLQNQVFLNNRMPQRPV